MKPRLRLALPALDALHPQSVLPFALLDRAGKIVRGGTLALDQFAATSVPRDHVEVVLHPHDAIVAQITVPPVRNKQLTAAVSGCVEPLLLSDITTLCIAHSTRAPDGQVTVAWADRLALQRAWHILYAAGLRVRAIVPHALAIAVHDNAPDQPLSEPVDARWQAPLPGWSLAQAELRPASGAQGWRAASWWVAAALAVWVVGLHIHAAQLRGQVRSVQQSMSAAIRAAFPGIPVIIDPVRQAQAQRDALRLAQGTSTEDDFMPLAMASAAALGFVANAVTSLTYEAGELVLTLGEGSTAPSDMNALQQSAAAQGLVVQADAQTPGCWRVRRATVADRGGRG